MSGRPPASRRRVAFFHPFTNDGGGGERVLWCMVRALQEQAAGESSGSPDAEACEWVVYTGDDATPASLSARAEKLFGVELRHDVKVVRLQLRWLVEPASWPRLTLLGQSLGSVALAAEALLRCTPSVLVDTSGFAFAYPVAKALAGCRVAAYTHYPTISTDMLSRVERRESIYNNAASVANSSTLSALKLYYYRAFALLYGLAGWCADVVMVNSSWTEAHIRSLWRWTAPARVHRVYPPCDTTALQKYPLERAEGGESFIISVAQFRPEKNHALQLRAFAHALEADKDQQREQQQQQQQEQQEQQQAPEQAAGEQDQQQQEQQGQHSSSGKTLEESSTAVEASPAQDSKDSNSSPTAGATSSKQRSWAGAAMSLLSFGRSSGRGQQPREPVAGAGTEGASRARRPLEGVRLKLVGGSRDGRDEERIEMLASLAEQLGIAGRVDFCVNVPFSELQEFLGSAACGLHTMLDEHFGISIVEYMAAGALAIANNSGGPRADILQPVEAQDGQLLPVGFLAQTVEEYSEAIRAALAMLPEERSAMAARARARAVSYSEDKFDQAVKAHMRGILGL